MPRLLARLAAQLGTQQASNEWRWMNDALASAPSGLSLRDMVNRRCRGEPLQYILGISFRSISFFSSYLLAPQVLSHLARLISLSVVLFSFLALRLSTGSLDSRRQSGQVLKHLSLSWTLAQAQGASLSSSAISGLKGAFIPRVSIYHPMQYAWLTTTRFSLVFRPHLRVTPM